MRAPCLKMWLLLFLLAFPAGGTLTSVALAQSTAVPVVPVEVESENGFARLIFKWERVSKKTTPPELTTTIENGVLLVHFNQSYQIDLDVFREETERFITLVRQDDDGRTLRMALKYPFELQSNTDELDVAVDLIPESYAGTPAPYKAPAPAIDLDSLVITGELRDVPTAEELKLMQVAAKPIPLDAPRLPVRVIRNDTRSRVVFQWPEKVGYDVARQGDTIVANFNQIAKPTLARLRVDPPKFVKNADAVRRFGGLEVQIEIEPDAVFSHFREGADIIIDVAPGHPEAEPKSDADELHHKEVSHAASKVVVEVVDTAVGVQVKFPWGRDVPAAIFRRGDYLWAIFDASAEIDLSAFERGSYYEVGDMVDFSTEDLTFIRLTLGPRALVTVRPDHHEWHILLGETAFGDTQNVDLVSDVKDPHQARVYADLPSANLVHRIIDPEVGDEIIVVTALGPAQGLITSRKYIDFLALPSGHGLAFQPIAEDLEVSIEEGIVSINKVGGLAVTGAGSGPELETVEVSEHGSAPGTSEAAGHGQPNLPHSNEPGFVRFTEWAGDEKEGYYATLAKLNEALGKAPKRARSERRFELAQFYFAYGLLAEAIGALNAIEVEDPAFTNVASYVALKGATQQRMHRNEEALDTLAHFSVKADPGAAIWRGMALESLGFHKKARAELAKGMQDDEDRYPAMWQARFRLAETKAALGVNDLEDANSMWENIALDLLDDKDRAEAYLVKGKILYAIGEPALALEYFRMVFPLTDGEMAHRARYNEVSMLYNVGELNADEAAERFEQLRYQWRGDDLELKALRALGDIYLDQERYREALMVMRVGFTFKPQHPISRNMRDKMGDVFEELYLDGKADNLKSTAAIALFYDFKELTPIGTKGDRMIRLLSERLVSIGLYDQAAELLQHQVEYRLKGTARSQVAMRLALIHLKNKRPEEAFRTISATRFSGLTTKLRGQRRLIEARALADMGRHNHAVELLEEDVSHEAEVLRANIYWDADNWPETGRVYEGLLEGEWGTDKALSNEARANVMRMAIAYALVDDKPALERVRRKFGVQMAGSPDAQAFNIATGDLALRGVAFRDVLRRVNSIDTFESFMVDFKNRFGDDGTMVN